MSNGDRFARNMTWLFGNRGKNMRHAYGGTSRTRYKRGYGGTKRRWRAGYDRTGGYYGRFQGRLGMSQGEMKFHDVDLDDAVVAAGLNITPSVNLIAQGITESTHNGRKATIKGIQWRYRVTLPEVDDSANPPTPDTIRVIMYLDTQCNGVTAVGLDILESADVHAFRNLSNGGRFQILHDKLITLNYVTMAAGAAGTQSVTEVVREHSFYKKVNIPIEWNDTTGAITEIRSNNIGVLLLGFTGACGFNSKIRLRFTDASMSC